MSSSIEYTGDRLNGSVIPKHYDLLIKSDLQDLTFTGIVKIKLEINEPVSSIVLHAHESLELGQAMLYYIDSESQQPHTLKASAINRDHELDQITVEFQDSILNTGLEQSLCMEFHGQIRDGMSGYYKNTYTQDGETRYFGMTQFGPTYAKQAFPCFDDPASKATFDITLIARKDTVSLSNTHIVNTNSANGNIPLLEDFCIQGLECKLLSSNDNSEWISTQFATTPKMSTYLVAYANGDFKFLESSFVSPITGKTIPVRIYALEDIISQCQYSLDVATQVVPIYEQMFNIPYPLHKLDVLAATDFEMGAMENWGLITGRAAYLAGDPKKSSSFMTKYAYHLQSHEVAHQWFGNIVTMEFWDGLWLNESFASFMGEVVVPNIIHPEWKSDSELLSGRYISAIKLDSLRSSHPVEVACNDSRLANQYFDSISYGKGTCILRQLANYIGLETFIKGTSMYLKKNMYGNAKTSDLWAGISEASGVDVAKVMDAWITKVGYPVVTVEETENGLNVIQNRFLSTGDAKPEEDETLWCIPLEIKYVDENGNVTVEHKHMLETREMFVPMSQDALKTYKLNAETTGFYITSYSSERWGKIGDEMVKPNGIFSSNDKLGILSNLSYLCAAGYVKTSTVLELIGKLKNETNEIFIESIMTFLAELKTVFWEYQEIVDSINALVRRFLKPLAYKLNMFDAGENETEEQIRLRTAVLAHLANANYEPVLAEVKRRFAPFLANNDRSLIPHEQLSMILTSSVKNGGEREYCKAMEIHDNPQNSHDSLYAICAVSRTQNEELIQRTFDAILAGKFKDQDIYYLFLILGKQKGSRRKLWTFFKENFSYINEKFTGTTMMGLVVKLSAMYLTTEEELEDVISFYKSHSSGTFQQSVDQLIDLMKKNIAWVQRDAEDIADSSKWSM